VAPTWTDIGAGDKLAVQLGAEVTVTLLLAVQVAPAPVTVTFTVPEPTAKPLTVREVVQEPDREIAAPVLLQAAV